MPRVRFVFDRKKTANKTNKKGLIEVEVYFNAKRTYFSTGMSVFKDQWRKDIIVGLQSMIEDNEYISSVKTILQEAVNKQFKETKSVNFDELRNIFAKSKKDDKLSKPTFIDFMKERMQTRPMAYGTWRQHRSVLNVLTDWGKIKTFEDLTPANILLWDELSRKHSKNGDSIETWHKCLKIYVREAITFGHISKDNNPYDGFKIKRDRSVKHAFLTQAELNKWCKVKLPSKLAEKARDLFIFCCYTGLSYADLSNFDTSLIFENNGGLRYVNDRVKSDETFHITILKPAKKILDKYNWELPKMDAHVYNRYLKDIALICGITKTITSHCGRCTFASTVLLANGFGLKTIANALGHASTRQTEEYAKLVSLNVDKSFDELNERL